MDSRRVAFGEIVEQMTVTVDPGASGITRYVAIEHLDPLIPSVERWGSIADGTTFTRKFEQGNVLFSKRRAYQRKAARASFGGVCSGDLIVLAAKPEHLDPNLLPFIVQSERFAEHAVTTSAGSLSPRTKWKELEKFELSLPSRSRQTEIARQLEQTEISRQRWRNVSESARISQRALVRESLDSARWPTTALKDSAVIRNGTTPSRKRPDYWDDGDIPWLPTAKVHDREVMAADEFVTERALKECSLKLVPKGSVLVAMIGQGKTRGSVAYLGLDATINQNFAAVIPGQELDSRFLFHILEGCYSRLRRMSQGSSQGALNGRLIGEFAIPLPPLDVQRALAKRCDAFGRATAQSLAHAERLLVLQHTLIDAVLMEAHV